MTAIEMTVVLVVCFVLAVLLFERLGRAKITDGRISCVNNLKQIGIAYRVWENDNFGNYPAQQPNGGMREILSNTLNAGRFAYLPYSQMQDQLGQSPKIVVCPADDRNPATNFFWGPSNAPPFAHVKAQPGFGSFDNTNVSYFCGVGATDTFPQSILGGDRNLGDGGGIDPITGNISSPRQDPYYGISGKTAQPKLRCGADVIINTNGQWSSAHCEPGAASLEKGLRAVAWSAKIHSQGNIAGAGNLLLGDGSAQECNSKSLRNNILRNASDPGNFAATDTAHTVTNGSIRLLIP